MASAGASCTREFSMTWGTRELMHRTRVSSPCGTDSTIEVEGDEIFGVDWNCHKPHLLVIPTPMHSTNTWSTKGMSHGLPLCHADRAGEVGMDERSQ